MVELEPPLSLNRSASLRQGEQQHQQESSNSAATASLWEEPSENDHQEKAVRSLRRRLWKAFQDEDVTTAIRAYTATLEDYHEWFQEEALQAEQKRQLEEEARLLEKKEKREARPAALKKFGSMVRSARHVMKHAEQQQSPKKGSGSGIDGNNMESSRGTTPLSRSRRNKHPRELIGKHGGSGSGCSSLKKNMEQQDLNHSTSHKKHSNNNSKASLPSSTPTPTTKTTTPGLLEFELKPSDPFLSNDFKCPWGTEDDPNEHTTTTTNQDGEVDYDTASSPHGKARSSSRKHQTKKQIQKQQRRQRHYQQQRKGTIHKPRFAGFFGRSNKADLAYLDSMTKGGKTKEDDNDEDISGLLEEDAMMDNVHMTTPLHEAARLGCPNLVGLMLQHGGDPNFRNGQSRTSLHMATGGLTEEEEGLLLAAYYHDNDAHPNKTKSDTPSTTVIASTATKSKKAHSDNDGDDDDDDSQFELIGSGVGIRTPIVEKEEPLDDDIDEYKRKSTRKALKRLFKHSKKYHRRSASSENVEEGKRNSDQVKGHSEATTLSLSSKPLSLSDHNRLQRLSASRMDTVLALLSWCHTGEDDPDRVGEGPSINSVDSKYRTALHYASELGRLDVCMAVLSSFGAILTLVDESGQTPCELAAARKHDTLAYQLEARALLYADPYGMDDELMANVLADAEFNETENSNNDQDYYPENEDHGDYGITSAAAVAAARRRRSSSATAASSTNNNNNNAYARPSRHGYRRKLVPPFSWFETWDMEEVQEERSYRITIALQQMRSILKEIQEQKEANEIMFSHQAMLDESMLSDTSILLNDYDGDGKAGVGVLCNSSDNDNTDYQKEENNNNSKQGKGQHLADTEGTDESDYNDSDLKPSSDNVVQASPLKDNRKIAPANTKELQEEDGTPPVNYEVEEDESVGAGNASLNDKKQKKTTDLADAIHESHAEGLLSSFDWDIKKAINQFKARPTETLKDAGVAVELNDLTLGSTTLSNNNDGVVSCLICFDEYPLGSNALKRLSGCNHTFCSECLGNYIDDCAKSNSGSLISCPHHECSALLMMSEIEALSPNRHVVDTLLRSADTAFVTACEDVRFCPHPGCGGVVKRIVPPYLKKAKREKVALVNFTGAVCTAVSHYDQDDEDIPITYEGVRDPNYNRVNNMTPPVKAHRFCFSCGEGMHWPISCETLEKWKETVAEEVGTSEGNGEAKAGEESFNDVAQRLWLKANTRPCPQCKAPIEKMEGCNHMTCTNHSCRHEFCWICRKDWKLHNSETGGFFRCNRWQEDSEDHEYYDTPPPTATEQQTEDSQLPTEERSDAPHLVDQGYGSAMHSARSAWKKSRTMARFLHHYRRWIAHSESAALERHMADTACSRLAPVIEAAIEFSGFSDFNFGGKGLAFVHSAFAELLQCRSLLQHSYAFAFTRYPSASTFRNNREYKAREREKGTFEQLQSELETLSEQLSDIVARSHLRATQSQIMFLTSTSAEKRREFTVLLISILDEARKEEKKEKEDKARGIHSSQPSSGSGRYPARPWDVDPMAPPWRRQTIGEPLNADTFPVTNLPPFVAPGIGGLHTLGGRGVNRDDGDDAIERVLHASMRGLMTQRSTAHEIYDGQDFNSSASERWTANWDCRLCTYMNSHGRFCAMCGTPRNN